MDIIQHSPIRNRVTDGVCVGKEQTMTREEAIGIIRNGMNPRRISGLFGLTDAEVKEATDMAISALEQMPEVTSTMQTGQFVYVKQPCEDAVSREAVLEGIEELKKSPWCTDKRNGYEYLIAEALDTVKDLCVKQLPSVTQKSGIAEIEISERNMKIWEEIFKAESEDKE